MNDTKPEAKYAPLLGSRTRETTFGEIISLNFNVKQFSEWMAENQNQSGYIRLDLSKRKTPSEKNTHSLKLDTWQPKSVSENDSPV